MAKQNLAKVHLVSPQETNGRQAALDALFERRLVEIGGHLGVLSDILFEHQDKVDHSPTVAGVANLLAAFGEELRKLAGEGGAE